MPNYQGKFLSQLGFYRSRVILTSDGWNKGGNGSRRVGNLEIGILFVYQAAKPSLEPPSHAAEPSRGMQRSRRWSRSAEPTSCEGHWWRMVSEHVWCRWSWAGMEMRPSDGVRAGPAGYGSYASCDELAGYLKNRPEPVALSSSPESPGEP